MTEESPDSLPRYVLPQKESPDRFAIARTMYYTLVRDHCDQHHSLMGYDEWIHAREAYSRLCKEHCHQGFYVFLFAYDRPVTEGPEEYQFGCHLLHVFNRLLYGAVLKWKLQGSVMLEYYINWAARFHWVHATPPQLQPVEHVCILPMRGYAVFVNECMNEPYRFPREKQDDGHEH